MEWIGSEYSHQYSTVLTQYYQQNVLSPQAVDQSHLCQGSPPIHYTAHSKSKSINSFDIQDLDYKMVVDSYRFLTVLDSRIWHIFERLRWWLSGMRIILCNACKAFYSVRRFTCFWIQDYWYVIRIKIQGSNQDLTQIDRYYFHRFWVILAGVSVYSNFGRALFTELLLATNLIFLCLIYNLVIRQACSCCEFLWSCFWDGLYNTNQRQNCISFEYYHPWDHIDPCSQWMLCCLQR